MTLGGHKQNLMHRDPGERSSDPTGDRPRLACECPGVSSGGVGWWWPATQWRALTVAVCLGPLEGGYYLHYIHHGLLSGQITGREHSPTYQQIIGLKIYWAWPRPSEQDPVSPTVSLWNQDASINLLFSSLRGQTEWNLQSQKTNQALSNSVKLWARLCRVMVESLVLSPNAFSKTLITYTILLML